MTISATDLDSARTEHSFTITTEESYSSWSENLGAGLPGKDDDGGGLINAQEFAFGSNPSNGTDDNTRIPAFVTITDGENAQGTLQFYHRQFAPELEIRIEATSDLKTWQTIWSSADGMEAPAVINVLKEGSFHKMTLSIPAAMADNRVLMLRSSIFLDLP